jgi:hypothetical protein
MQITRIRAELTQNQRKQRRLAGAISARDADFLSRVDLKAGIAEQQRGPRRIAIWSRCNMGAKCTCFAYRQHV